MRTGKAKHWKNYRTYYISSEQASWNHESAVTNAAASFYASFLTIASSIDRDCTTSGIAGRNLVNLAQDIGILQCQGLNISFVQTLRRQAERRRASHGALRVWCTVGGEIPAVDRTVACIQECLQKKITSMNANRSYWLQSSLRKLQQSLESSNDINPDLKICCKFWVERGFLVNEINWMQCRLDYFAVQ